MVDTDDYLRLNRAAWDQRTAIHIDSSFYDVAGFLAGQCSLTEIERNALGDVQGKSLLHLQCHFGLDTLSWARKGAQVTGVDLSPRAIAEAERLQQKTGQAARFICADVYDFGQHNEQRFDIVFVSFGALCWLPDITRWANVVAKSLAPGGIFYLAEFHPVQELLAGGAYFHSDAAEIVREKTYTEGDSGEEQQIAVWNHTLSEVLNALIGAGLQITAFNEYAYSPYNCFTGLQECEPGRFYLSHGGQDVPLVYSVSALASAD